MTNTHQFQTSVSFKDIFGSKKRILTGETPYEIMFDIFYDQNLVSMLPEMITLTFTHLPTKEKKRFKINLHAIDDDETKCPKFLNESDLDDWLKTFSIEI